MYIKILKIYERVQDIILENSDLIKIVCGYWEKIKQKQESLIEAIDECDVQLYELLQENGVL